VTTPRAAVSPAHAAPRPARILVAAALACLALAGCGCQRRSRFVPLQADSTTTLSVDSIAVIARDLQLRWEAPGAGEEAARLSARFVLADLMTRTRIDPTMNWESRARTVLDSLGVGAETASTRCALVVNFFARSDPDQGAWPWLFWCGPKSVLAQPLEGRGLKLVAVTARGLWGDPPKPPGPASVALLFGRRSAIGQQLLAMVWTLGGGHATLVQTLGPDSLGGTGTGEFEASSDTAIDLVARTYRPAPRFDECPTCPHVYHVHRFHWGAQGFERVSDESISSPYSTFAEFLQALAVDDRSRAWQLVTDPSWVEAARRLQWGTSKGEWRVAPSTDETAREMVFFHGRDEAYRVTFEQRGGSWRISGFRTTTQSVE
jgi:hypothetical protein